MATVEEQRAAYRVGISRSHAARRRNAPHLYGYDTVPEAQRIDFDGQSAVSEFLVAEATGRRWLSYGMVADAPLDGDVEGGLQVRWTAHLSGHLIVHESDPDGLIYVLVVGRAPRQKIVGWMNGIEAKSPLYWREPPQVRSASYFVPQSALSPLYLLAKALA